MTTSKKYIAKRSKIIGKKMMGCLYIHKSAINTLPSEYMQLLEEKMSFVKHFDFDIIKINPSKREVSFTNSPDWTTSQEPLVGDSILVKSDNSIKLTKGSNLIYHHKWQFVEDSYNGFDVELSKKRSEFWMNHPIVLAMKEDSNEKFNSKIGRKTYWENNVCSKIE